MHEKIREYLVWKKTHRAFAADRYKHWLYRFVEACGDKEIEKYGTNDIATYHGWLQQRFSHTSVRYAMSILKNFFLFFKMNNYNCMSPQLIQLPRMGKPNSHKALTANDFDLLIKAITPNTLASMRDLLIIRMLWDTGIRVSELCDIDLSSLEKESRKVLVSTKKTSNMRLVFWSEETDTLLLQYLEKRTALKMCDSPALFIGQKGRGKWKQRLTTRSVQRMIKSYAVQAGIKTKVTPHSTRHGWAHVRRDKGAPLPFIQRGLGHVNPMSSFVYQQYSDPELETSARTFFA